MSRYDGLIIPRSYSDYINKTDAATLSQALQLSGVMDAAPTAASTKPAKSGGIFAANAVIMASSATLTGVAISAGSVVRVLFTADLTGSDATTGLTITYNGNTYAVKVGKDGALVALTAHLIEESFVYLQAYTTLELAFDGSQFVVMGNPVVISNADFSIMADGSIADKRIYYDITENIIEDNVNRWVATQDCLLEWTYISKIADPNLIVNGNVVSVRDAVSVANELIYISTCSVKIKKGDVVTSNVTWSNVICRAIPIKS